jgi:hypothetical protein
MGTTTTKTNAVWLRIVPIVVIALCAAGLCVQAACSGGSGTSYGYQ